MLKMRTNVKNLFDPIKKTSNHSLNKLPFLKQGQLIFHSGDI